MAPAILDMLSSQIDLPRKYTVVSDALCLMASAMAFAPTLPIALSYKSSLVRDLLCLMMPHRLDISETLNVPCTR